MIGLEALEINVQKLARNAIHSLYKISVLRLQNTKTIAGT